jgi:kynurenine formamidase
VTGEEDAVIVDLTHVVETGMPIFPGDPDVAVEPAASEPPWRLTDLRLGSHSGTHMDAASHLVTDGRTIDQYPLDRFVVDARVVHLEAGPLARLEWADLSGRLPADLNGAGVLLHTGWDEYWGGEGMGRHPYLTADAARRLVAAGVTLVGTDALNVDGTDEPGTAAHETLLGADVLIVENLTNLGALAAGRAHRCAFVPLRLLGADGSPVRAFAWTDA